MNEPELTEDFERLLLFLKNTRGFDFTAYKRTTLGRRVRKRMETVGSPTFSAYRDYLEVHPDEFPLLFNTILINVTGFFRDDEAWTYVREEIVPKLLARRGQEPLRLWSAGCASGEEAYTVAMVLADVLGREAFADRVKIYATDLDEEALAQSRAATYSGRDLASVPSEFREQYFESVNGHFVFDRELRRSVIFGRHDLLQDAPISRVDLLLCRNALMYFNAEAQERILARFHFALNDGGFLYLGKAETLLTHASTFTPVDLKHRVFTKSSRSRPRDRALLFGAVQPVEPRNGSDRLLTLREAAADAVGVAQVVLDQSGHIAFTNERARHVFGLSMGDLGRPFQDLEVSFRPVELRSTIEAAFSQRRTIIIKDVPWTSPTGEMRIMEVRVAALFSPSGEFCGSSVAFEDVTQYRRLQEELLNFNQELETAYEEV